jgi:hypothetical protein
VLIHGDKLRWLLWLRWKLFLRAFTRKGKGQGGQIIGMAIFLIFLLIIAFAFSALIFNTTRFLPAPANIEVLFLVLSSIYVFWIIFPLLEFNMNEGLDLSKLATFPLTRWELMFGLLASTLLDLPTFGLLILLGSVIAGMATSLPMALFTLLAMIVFYFQLIGTSQFVLTALMRVLQSRRFRDLGVLLIVLVSFTGYFAQFLFRGLASSSFLNLLNQQTFSPYLQWLPSGMVCRAIEQANAGNWGSGFLWLLAPLAIGFVALYLWQSVVEKGLVAPDVEKQRKHQHKEVDTVPAGGLLGRLVPGQAYAVLLKDMRYIRRDPQITALLLQAILLPIFAIVVSFLNIGNNPTGLNVWLMIFTPLVIALTLYRFSYNALGFERASLTTLFLFPLRPMQLLWGKNLVAFGIGLIELLIMLPIATFLTRNWDLFVPSLVSGIAAILIIVGCGNASSVFFPQKWKELRRGMQTSTGTTSEAGCLRALMSLGALIAMVALTAPVALGTALPVLFHAQWILALSVPLGLAYSMIIYVGVTRFAGARLVKRMPEILEAVTK